MRHPDSQHGETESPVTDIDNYQIGRGPTGRRSFPIAFQIDVLRRWDECTEHGAKTRLLRELNLSKNHVTTWLRAREKGQYTQAMVATAEKSRSRMDSRDRAELARLRRENEQLKAKVEQAETAQAILGKAFELLQGITKRSDTEPFAIPPALMSAREYAQWLEHEKLS